MRLIAICIALAIPTAGPLFGGDFTVIDNCDTVEAWRPKLTGASGSSVEVSKDSLEGSGSLLVTFAPEKEGLEEVAVTCTRRVDLSGFDRLEFWVKGLAPGKKFYFRLKDSHGKELETEFNPGYLIEDISRASWRRITILLRGKDIDLRSVDALSFVVTDEKAPRSKKKAALWIDYIAVFSGPPPDNPSFRYPDELRVKRWDRMKVLYIREPLEEIRKRWNMEAIIKSIDEKSEIKEVTWSYVPWKDESELSYFPPFYSELTGYDLVILEVSDLPKEEYHGMLKDYVEGGGALLVLGGYVSLGKARMERSLLSEMLPCRTTGLSDMARGSSISAAGDSTILSGIALRADLSVEWYQKVEAKAAAVHMKVGEDPVLLTWRYGSGGVGVFSATVLGSGVAGRTPLWKWRSYPELMKRLIQLLTGEGK